MEIKKVHENYINPEEEAVQPSMKGNEFLFKIDEIYEKSMTIWGEGKITKRHYLFLNSP